jgi:hypothetical protein
MSLIGNLAVGITANAEGFVSGINKALKTLDSFKSSVISAATSTAGIMAGLTGVAAGGGLMMMVKQQMDAVDSSAKLADRLNMDIGQLRGLQYAAGLAGASSEDLNNSLEKMNKVIGDAVSSTKTAQASFTALGLDFKALARQDAATTFKQIADKIAALPTPSQRASAAMDIFGKGYASIMTLIETGSSDMDKMIERFNMLAGSLNRLDAAKVEIAGDRLSDLKVVVEGLAAKVAVELSPFIAALSEKLIELGFNGKNMAQSITNGFEMMASAVAYVSDYTELLKAGFYGFIAVTTSVSATFIHMFAEIGKAVDILIQKFEKISGVKLGLGGEGNNLDALAKGLDQDALSYWDSMNASYKKFSDGANSNSVGKWFDDLNAKANKAAQSVADVAKAKQKLAESTPASESSWVDETLKKFGEGLYESTRTAAEKLKEQIGKIEQAYRMGYTDSDTAGRAVDQAKKSYDDSLKKDANKVGGFKVVDTSLMSVAGMMGSGKKQVVTDPQLEQTNSLLKSIRTVLSTNTAVAQ